MIKFQISTLQPPQKYNITPVWRTWLFIAYSDERGLYCQFSPPHQYIWDTFPTWEWKQNQPSRFGSNLFRSRVCTCNLWPCASQFQSGSCRGCTAVFTCICWYTSISLSLPSSKSTFSQPFKEKSMSEVARIGSLIIFHLSQLWKAKFSILCNVIFLVRLQGNLKLITLGVKGLILSLPRVIKFKFLLHSHQKYYITQYGELGFS